MGNFVRFANVYINLENTLNCGQCFRWKSLGNGVFEGVVSEKVITARVINKDFLVEFDENSKIDEMKTLVREYFDLNRDYESIIKKISFCSKTLEDAIKFSPGIRILKQDPWESLCSFIISQNNNIARISGIIEHLCNLFGKKISKKHYSFPKAEVLSTLTEKDLLPIRSGFRAKYILDAAKKVTSDEVNLKKIHLKPTEVAREELKKIFGVGDKVADCTLLYGFNRLEVVPKDVWMKRIISLIFSKTKSIEELFESYSGIAQIYLFNYIRKNSHILSEL